MPAELSGCLRVATDHASSREATMARKYSKSSQRKVGRALHEMKSGELHSGRSGATVKSRKQAIAIGLAEARREGKKVPPPPRSSSRSSSAHASARH